MDDTTEAGNEAVWNAIRQRFGTLLKSEDRLEQRAKDEHDATKKRRPRAVPKLQFNVRATQETRDLIDALAQHYGKSLSDVIELAAQALAKATPGFKRGKP
jgi:hypothetical protein